MKPLFKAKADDSTYTAATKVPQYTPSKEMPLMAELYNYDKYVKLCREIDASGVSEEEKNFLKKAASRHIVFHYNKIADYYAHASAEMQTLMEHSALVILDVDDAIANGYVELSKNIRDIMNATGRFSSDA